MSWQNTVLTWALRKWVKPNLGRNRDIAKVRASMGRTAFSAKLPADWRMSVGTEAPLNGDWIEPAAPTHAARRRCVLYLHGGGYFAMSPKTHRVITSRLAVWSNSRLFALDYRLAPEHPFPAALDDAVAAFRALIATGTPAAEIVVAGDSAGGGLALGLLLALRDAGETLPAGALLFSPWTDLAVTGQSVTRNAATDPLLDAALVAPVARLYLGDASATNPLASPVYADLRGLPPVFIQVSDSEILLDDSQRIAENARRSGVVATLRTWPGLPHVWHLFAPFLPEGRDALREAAAFVGTVVR